MPTPTGDIVREEGVLEAGDYITLPSGQVEHVPQRETVMIDQGVKYPAPFLADHIPLINQGALDPTRDFVSFTSGTQAVLVGNANLTANTDNAYTFTISGIAVQVHHILLQNLTGAAILFELDNTASANSLSIGAGYLMILDLSCTTLHLFSTGTPSINVAAGLQIRAWL